MLARGHAWYAGNMFACVRVMPAMLPRLEVSSSWVQPHNAQMDPLFRSVHCMRALGVRTPQQVLAVGGLVLGAGPATGPADQGGMMREN